MCMLQHLQSWGICPQCHYFQPLTFWHKTCDSPMRGDTCDLPQDGSGNIYDSDIMLDEDDELQSDCDRCRAGGKWVQARREPAVYHLPAIRSREEQQDEVERIMANVDLRPMLDDGSNAYLPLTREVQERRDTRASPEQGWNQPMEPYVGAAGPRNVLASGAWRGEGFTQQQQQQQQHQGQGPAAYAQQWDHGMQQGHAPEGQYGAQDNYAQHGGYAPEHESVQQRYYEQHQGYEQQGGSHVHNEYDEYGRYIGNDYAYPPT